MGSGWIIIIGFSVRLAIYNSSTASGSMDLGGGGGGERGGRPEL